MEKDSVLIAMLNCGSKQAFAALYDMYAPRIFSYSMKMLHNDALAEDITQFCFMKVWEKRNSIRPDTNFPAYIYTIAKNAVYKEARRNITSRYYIESILKLTEEGTDSLKHNVDLDIITNEIDKVIDKLPAKRRLIYEMSTKQMLTNKEIALQLNISPKTVEAQICRIAKELRRQLKQLL